MKVSLLLSANYSAHRPATGRRHQALHQDDNPSRQIGSRQGVEFRTDTDLPPINVPERLLVPGCCGASFS